MRAATICEAVRSELRLYQILTSLPSPSTANKGRQSFVQPGLLTSRSGADLTAAGRERERDRDAENIAPGSTVSKATGGGGINGGWADGAGLRTGWQEWGGGEEQEWDGINGEELEDMGGGLWCVVLLWRCSDLSSASTLEVGYLWENLSHILLVTAGGSFPNVAISCRYPWYPKKELDCMNLQLSLI